VQAESKKCERASVFLAVGKQVKKQRSVRTFLPCSAPRGWPLSSPRRQAGNKLLRRQAGNKLLRRQAENRRGAAFNEKKGVAPSEKNVSIK
jgi:hypothetical protein